MNRHEYAVRAARHARIIRANFALTGGIRGTLLIKNVSAEGIGARCDYAHVREGDEILVDMPLLGSVEGVVKWVRNGHCGIQTYDPLDVERLRFRQDNNLLSSPAPFSVAERFQPVTRTYRPGLKSF